MPAIPISLSYILAAIAIAGTARATVFSCLNATSTHVQFKALKEGIQDLETVVEIARRKHALERHNLQNVQRRLAGFQKDLEDYQILVARIESFQSQCMALVTGQALLIRRCRKEVANLREEIATQTARVDGNHRAFPWAA